MTMFRRTALALAIGLLLPRETMAQESPRTEVGLRAGVTHSRTEFSSVTLFALPGAGTFSPQQVHLAWFLSEKDAVEPAVGLQFRVDEPAAFRLHLTAQLSRYARGAADSPFAFLFGSVLAGESPEAWALGGGAGYRWVGDVVATRLEARYRRWFGDFSGVQEFSLLVGLGVLLGEREE